MAGRTIAGRAGIRRGKEVYYAIVGAIPEEERKKYASELIRLLREHKFSKRRKTDEKHPRANPSDKYDITDPSHFAESIILLGHLLYNANTANNYLKGCAEGLQELADENFK